MRRRLSLPFRLKPLIITGVVLLSFVATAAASLLPASNASAQATTYATETDLPTIMKAIKYMNAIAYCAMAETAFKTSITGNDISNGPRWWVNDNGLYAPLSIGKQLDKWGDKNGVTKCNGESDSEPGWISDALTFFGINVRNSDKNNRDKSLVELGYKCPAVTSGDLTCTNDNANKDVNTKGSILYILTHLPYLNGTNLVNIASPNQKFMAASYYAAIADYTKLCGATAGASTSNIASIYVVSSSGTISQQQYGGGKSSLDGGSGEVSLTANGPDGATGAIGTATVENGCPDGITKYLTKSYADAYVAVASKSACSKLYSDANLAAACVDGASNNSNLGYCTTHYVTGYQGSSLVNNDSKRLACYAGQGNQGEEDCVATLKYTLNAPATPNFTNTQLLQACIAGAQNSSPTYCTSQYGDAYVGSTLQNNSVLRQACTDGQKYPAAGGLTLQQGCTAGSTDPNCTPAKDSPTSCVVDGIGWLVCPLINAIGGLNDAMYGWVQSVLVLNPLTQTDSNGATTPQYQNWSVIRNIANVLLVIGFLAIIFSQISSIGISNYGVKKMLPRIVLVAIGINLSWTLMSLAVDVVNVIGVGLHTLLSSLAVSDSISTAKVVEALVTGATSVALGGAIGTVAIIITGSSASVLVLLALPFLLGAALALLAAVATLFVRNALVIILVIIAPVAIAASILPNTEDYFKRWRKLLTSMLFLFPMAAVLFAGCKFAAFVILTSNMPFAVVAALFIMAAPLGLLPWLARSSGGIMATVGNRLGGLAKSGQGALTKGLSQSVATRRAEYKSADRGFWGNRTKAKPIKNSGDKYDTDGEHWATRKDGTMYKASHKAGDVKRDVFGNEINQKSAKKTVAGSYNSHVEGLKTRQATAEKGAVSNFKEIGLRADGSKASVKIAGIVDASETQGLRDKAIGAQYEARLQNRQLAHGSAEMRLTENLEDAEATSKAFQGRLKQEQAERIRDGASNTVAGSIGAEGILNLRDASQQAYVAEAGAAAAEAQNSELNINSRAADNFIQIEHEAKEGIKVRETEQEADFKQHQNERAEQNLIDRETDPTVELDNTLKQNAQDRRVETNEAEIKARQEGVARKDENLEELERRKRRAEFQVENIHNAENSEFEASKLAGGDNADLAVDSIIGKAESDRIAAEQKRIESEARFGTNQQNPDGSGTMFTADQLAGIVHTDQDTQASQAAGAYAEGGKQVQYAQEIDDDTARGRELAVAASGSDPRIKDRDGKPIMEEFEDESGNPVYEMEADGITPQTDPTTGAPIRAKRPKVAILAQAKAAKVVLEDKEGDQNTIVSLAKSKRLPNKEALSNLGVDINTGKQIVDAAGNPVVPDLTDAAKLGYIRYAAGRGDRQTTMSLLSHVGRIGRDAAEARRLASEPTATETDKENADRLTQEAKDAQQVLLEAGDSSLPPWMGGSDKQKLAEGTFEYDTDEAALAAAAGGKLTADAFAAMDINNRDEFVRALTSLDPNGTPEGQAKYKNVMDKVAESLAREEHDDYDSLSETDKEAAKAAVRPRMAQNFAQVIIPIDKAQFDVRLNRNLAARDRARYEEMRTRLRELANIEVPTPMAPRVPMIIKPDGSEQPYKGYDPSV